MSLHNSYLLQYRPRTPVILVGMMGSGKTSVGKALSKILRVPFIDSDAEIQYETGMSIPQIFQEKGEAAFRKIEADVIARLVRKRPLVLSTGGGAVITESTASVIFDHARFISIWMDADVDTLARRTEADTNRPLLDHKNHRASLKKLLEARRHLYARAMIHHDANSDDVHGVTVRLAEKISIIAGGME